MNIVFVHPAEFLVSVPDGSTARWVLLCDRPMRKPFRAIFFRVKRGLVSETPDFSNCRAASLERKSL